jgi:hypothetical protein
VLPSFLKLKEELLPEDHERIVLVYKKVHLGLDDMDELFSDFYDGLFLETYEVIG